METRHSTKEQTTVKKSDEHTHHNTDLLCPESPDKRNQLGHNERGLHRIKRKYFPESGTRDKHDGRCSSQRRE
jgi:hypothetical protein